MGCLSNSKKKTSCNLLYLNTKACTVIAQMAHTVTWVKQFEQWTSGDLTVPLHWSQHQASCGIKCQLGIETGWMALGAGWLNESSTETYLCSSLACFQSRVGAWQPVFIINSLFLARQLWHYCGCYASDLPPPCDPIIAITKTFSFFL